MDDVADEEDHDHKGGNVGHPLSNTNRIPYNSKLKIDPGGAGKSGFS